MKSVQNFSLSISLLMCAVLSTPANAWSGGIRSMACHTSFLETRFLSKANACSLGYKIGISEDVGVEMVPLSFPNVLPVTPTAEALNRWELPRHSPSPDDATKEKLLWDIEMTLGRVAMVAGFFLLLNEIVTGQSIADQVVKGLFV